MTVWKDGSSTLRAASLLESRTRVPNVVYAADFGVTADGVTDDATALNNAMLAATGPSETRRTALYLPDGYIMVGSQIVVGNGVSVRGVGKRGSHIKAISGTFPTNTPVVRLGDPAQPIAFDMRLENLAVDASGIANSTCVYSRNGNEGTGCFSVAVVGFGKYGIWYEMCSIVDAVDIEAFGDGGLATAIACVYFQGCAGENMIRSATVTPASAAGYGVWVSGGQYHVSDIHCEQSASGIRVTGGSGNIENVCGNPSVTDLVHIEANTRDWTAQNINLNGSTHTLVDDLAGLTIDVQQLQFYFQDNLRINKTKMISSGGDPTGDTNPHLIGEVAWNQTPTAGGGSSPFAGWMCVASGTPGTWVPLVIGQRASVAITYSASMTPNAATAEMHKIVATNTTAFTINAPTNPTNGAALTLDIKNSSGGAMGAVTFNAVFLLAGAFVNPANTKRRTITFYYDGTNWVERSRAAADI